MTIDDDISFLGHVPTFARLGFSTLQIVAIGSETKKLADGEILFRAGETTDAGYVIREGSLRLTTYDLGRSDQDVTFGPGTLIGELALVTETICSGTAIAIEPSTVIRISRSLFCKVLEGFPESARVMRDRFAERVNLAGAELSLLHEILEKWRS
jgi:CRP-like cAMP-binding protein